MLPITRPKFLSMTSQQQHRHCAQVLRRCYELFPVLTAMREYRDLASWLKLEPLAIQDRSAIADRYHEHCQQAGLSLKEHELLPQVRTGDSEHPFASPLTIDIYLERLRSAHNVGSICRTVEAFQLGTIHLDNHTPGPENKKVRDAAMGTEQWVNWTQTGLNACPRPLIALETTTDAISLSDFTFPDQCTLALGNEEEGCSTQLLADADAVIEIPLVGRKNSLNVANAFAIAANAVHSQHRNRKEAIV